MTYRYIVDFHHQDGSAAGSAPLTPDWTNALQWVHFEGVRRALFPPVPLRLESNGTTTVEPLWHVDDGPPYVAGFRACVVLGGASLSRDIPASYVRDGVRSVATSLVDAGTLQAGEAFRYRISAFPAQAPAMPELDGDFAVEEIIEPLPLEDAALSWFVTHSRPIAHEDVDHDLPVFIAPAVLDEALELARQAGDVETGGILVGKLCRDASVPEIFVIVTAFVPAPYTQQGSTKLTFTADTWAAARTAIALRRENETMAGWAHSHVDFCRLRNCPIERRQVCTAASPFFSAEDVHLHRTCFPSPYHTALLTSESTAEGWRHTLFGWRYGMVTARGFHILQTGAL